MESEPVADRDVKPENAPVTHRDMKPPKVIVAGVACSRCGSVRHERNIVRVEGRPLCPPCVARG